MKGECGTKDDLLILGNAKRVTDGDSKERVLMLKE
jgi:hypothetical protein